jgi:penicillin-binding protein 1A
VLVWDLARVNPNDIEPGEEADRDVRRMATIRTLEAGEIYAGLVERVDEKEATIDLGTAKGLLPLADVAWARKWNPVSATAAPKRMSSVVTRGDVVLVRVMQGKLAPERAAQQGKPLALSLEQKPRVQGALVAIDPVTRGVRALVGGYEFGETQFNRATQAKRQPGSSFKPFVWGAAIESRRFTPATMVYDTPDIYRDRWTGKEWKPKNFERDEFDGSMLLQAALAHSKNTVSVKLVDALGVDAVQAFARRMGIGNELPQNLTLALGTGEVYPIELVNGYASIAAHGFYTPPIMVLRVRDRNGKVLEETRPVLGPVAAGLDPSATANATSTTTTITNAAGTATTTVVTEAPPPSDFPIPEIGTRSDVAFVLENMMKGVIDYGTGAAAKALGRPAAGKTGTAQEHRDAWFVGFTPDLVAGVWVGFDDHSPLGPRETGAGAALPAWLSFMQAAVGGRPSADFAAPPGVELVRIDATSGLLAPGERTDAPFVAFLAGTAPKETASSHPGSAPQNFFMDDR